MKLYHQLFHQTVKFCDAMNLKFKFNQLKTEVIWDIGELIFNCGALYKIHKSLDIVRMFECFDSVFDCIKTRKIISKLDRSVEEFMGNHKPLHVLFKISNALFFQS
jgi:hypothetical protein